jgi:uncharacterized protein
MAQNRLASSSSAYLRSASHQPIDWYEFGDDAFQRAKELDRPILLDVGAVWCHWCHVIDRESYENDEIAQIINEHFVAVKVDRDQRPDIDARYQQVVASLTGQGGWPLTAFLTYDGRVIYGGTYFPPQAMKKLLSQIKDVYHEQKDEIMKETLADILQEKERLARETAEAEKEKPELSETLLYNVANSANSTYDTLHGGFGVLPKFPHYSALEFLIQQAFHIPGAWHGPIIEKTLVEMANGGIYDHICGGFHRYSVDRVWHVPHFEKMAYDNAEALRVYTQAYRLKPNPLYLQVIDGILKFTETTLSDQQNGGFYASQDADIDLHDDGDHFTWTINEVREILTPEETDVVLAYYDITAEGDMRERPGRNVLRVTRSIRELAKQCNRSEAETEEILCSARAKMAEKRANRPIPFIDQTIYLNWNGMYLVAYFETADLMNRPEVRQFAQKTLDRLLQTHVDTGRNILLHVDGVEGLLEDYAWMIAALLKGYQSTGEKHYLDVALHWTGVTVDLFEDELSGGFFDIATREEDALGLLKFRRKPVEDTPSSSANAVMVRNLIQLYLMTGEERYKRVAQRALNAFTEVFGRQGIFSAALGVALYEFLHPPLKLEVLGQEGSLYQAAQEAFYPGKAMIYVPEAEEKEIRACVDTRCVEPARSPAELQEHLNLFIREEAR